MCRRATLYREGLINVNRNLHKAVDKNEDFKRRDRLRRQDFRITPYINYAYIHCLKKTKDRSLARFVCPPAFVHFTIAICVSRDRMKTTYRTSDRFARIRSTGDFHNPLTSRCETFDGQKLLTIL